MPECQGTPCSKQAQNLKFKWLQSYIKLIESKIPKNIGVLFKGSLHLNKKCLSKIYFSFTHSYTNYGNLHEPVHPRLSLKKYLLSKKHAVRIIFHEEKESHAWPLLKN